MAAERIAVVGVGAVGATIAAAAQQAGLGELVLCNRSPLDEIVVEAVDGQEILVRPICTDPSEVGEVDVVFLAVKAHQTAEVGPWLDRLVGDETVIAVLQNGVEHREGLAPLVGAGTSIVPAAIWFGAETTGPGRVRVQTRPRLIFPESAAARRIAPLLGDTVEVGFTDDFATEAWRKLCHNATAGLMALAGRPAVIFRDPEVHALALALATECAEVARAEGADLPLSLARKIADGLASEPPDRGSSILADRLANRPLEWEARNGVVRRAGARHGIPTPISDIVVPLLQAASLRDP